MSEPIDPHAVMNEHHGSGHYCGFDWHDQHDPCEPYRLAEALVAEQAKVARARALPSYVDDERFAWVNAGDLRAALADQSEQDR